MSDYNYQPNEQYPNYQEPQQPKEEKASVGLAILSFLIPLAGLIIFIVNKDKKPKTAKTSGICALVSFLLGIVGSIIMTVSGGALLFSAVDDTAKEIADAPAASVQADGDAAISDNKLGDYECVVKGAKMCKNWDGKDAVEISFDFTNNSSEAASFDIALNASAYQNGVGLESSFLSDDDTSLVDVEIKPGVTKEVKKIYELRDTTSPVEIEITETFSLDDDKITTSVELG